jgi:hypothetical protein
LYYHLEHHRKLQLLKQAIFSKITNNNDNNIDKKTESTEIKAEILQELNENEETNHLNIKTLESFNLEELLHKLHHVLVQCQIFGDQKIKLTSQITETLSSRTRQLGFDSKSYG